MRWPRKFQHLQKLQKLQLLKRLTCALQRALQRRKTIYGLFLLMQIDVRVPLSGQDGRRMARNFLGSDSRDTTFGKIGNLRRFSGSAPSSLHSAKKISSQRGMAFTGKYLENTFLQAVSRTLESHTAKLTVDANGPCRRESPASHSSPITHRSPPAWKFRYWTSKD